MILLFPSLNTLVFEGAVPMQYTVHVDNHAEH
jgi:hypothetical protein